MATKFPPYNQNKEYYSGLIDKINKEIDFPNYLINAGYKLIDKSKNSMEFQSGNERIVLLTKNSPTSYFTRGYDNKKGLFFSFLKGNTSNFYDAIEKGLKEIQREYEIKEDIKVERPKQTTKSSNSLEDNFNIVPLRNSRYLIQDRNISEETLNNVFFKNRLFNAYHIKDTMSKIPNIAFPKYDSSGTIKNYVIRNKEYVDKNTGKKKKFRLVLNSKDQYLFYSNPEIQNLKKILFAENEIDALSHQELTQEKSNWYFSFGGTFTKEKMDIFIETISQKLSENTEIKLVSITDNDKSGYEYDIKLYSRLISHFNKEVYLESSRNGNTMEVVIHYLDQELNNKTNDFVELKKGAFEFYQKNGDNSAELVEFKDRIKFSFKYVAEGGKSIVEGVDSLINKINEIYLPFSYGIEKSKSKDWNEQLKVQKKNKNFLRQDKVIDSRIMPGDRILLSSDKGPEGGKNEGIVIMRNKTSVEVDFGLRYSYNIPFKQIKVHYCKREQQKDSLQETKEITKNQSIKI